MKKVVIALTATLSVFAVGIGALFLWEYRSKAQLEAQVEDYLGACDLSPTAMDVRGRPYILSAMSDRAELTYVDIAPQPGMTKDQLLIQELKDGSAKRVRRFVTFAYPSQDAAPITESDGSFSDRARIDGTPVTFSGTAADGTLTVFADGRPMGELRLPRDVALRGVFANEAGVAAELEYAANLCG